MCVAEGRVRDRDVRALAQVGGEAGRAEPQETVPAPFGPLAVGQLRQLGTRPHVTLARAVRLVDGHVGEVGEQLGRPVLAGRRVEQLGALVDEARGDLAGLEGGVAEHALEEGEVGRDPTDPELRQGPAGAAHGQREGRGAAGELDEHGVEVGADLGADEGRAAVEAHARAACGAVGRDRARVGTEAVGRVLGGDAALQREAVGTDVLLPVTELGERGPGGDLHLHDDEVDLGDLLGHGVLDLDARVHLDEDVATVLAEQELDGAGVDVVDRLRELHRVGAHALAQVRVEVGRGGDLDDLLVAALHGAVALEEVQDLTAGVADDLHLDVPRIDHGLLEVHRRVAEGGLGLTLGGLEGLAQVLAPRDPAHATPTTAADGLDEDREARLLGGPLQDVQVGARLGPTEGGQAGRLGRGDGARLVAGELEDLRRRADEGDAVGGALLGELGVLRQEPVAGVDRVDVGLDRHAHDLLGVEVGADRVALLTDQVGLVGLHPVLRQPVLHGVDGDGRGVELGGRAEGADGDLASVGDEDLAEHGASGV